MIPAALIPVAAGLLTGLFIYMKTGKKGDAVNGAIDKAQEFIPDPKINAAIDAAQEIREKVIESKQEESKNADEKETT